MKSTLSYELIERAIWGDDEAVNRIVAIYEPYINTLASKPLYDADSNEYIGVNVDLRDRLVRKLISLIHTYKVA